MMPIIQDLYAIKTVDFNQLENKYNHLTDICEKVFF